MASIDVFSPNKEKVGEIELADNVFGVEPKEHLFYMVVRYQLAKRRAGTHAVKTRSQVSGGGRKPYRQKGTGRARQGSSRSPHYRGGGVSHGPVVRSHAHKLPKKVRKLALCGALSRRRAESRLTVLSDVNLGGAKTRLFADLMERFGFEDVLLVVPEKDETVDRTTRNIPTVTVLPVDGLNVYDVLRHKNLVVTQDAARKIESRLGG